MEKSSNSQMRKPMDFRTFQEMVSRTDILTRSSPNDSREPLLLSILGMLGEAGSLASLIKKLRRDSMTISNTKELIERELADVLWYSSAIASHCDLDLATVAELGLRRAADKHGDNQEEKWTPEVFGDPLDTKYPVNERFPRQIIFRFTEETREDDSKEMVRISLARASGSESLKIEYSKKKQPSYGGLLFRELGDPLTDNAREADGYRYHDAIHIGFLAVLGWSPVLRQLLGLKRRSDRRVDEIEDGARAIDIEEGISSWLASHARLNNNFSKPSNVDTETLDFLRVYTKDREVSRVPAWAWKYAISGGFNLWEKLESNKGGFAKVDLDGHTVEFSSEMPALMSQDY